LVLILYLIDEMSGTSFFNQSLSIALKKDKKKIEIALKTQQRLNENIPLKALPTFLDNGKFLSAFIIH